MPARCVVVRSIVPVLALVAMAAAPARAAADERHPVAAQFAAGTLLFADNAVASERFIGAAALYYVLPRIGIGPEIVAVSGDGHDHLALTGNVTFDFLAPTHAVARTVTPFAVVGAGLFRTRESFPRGTFASSEGAFTAGGGVRARLGPRAFAGAEVRVGWELHIRVNAVVGVHLGR